MATLDRLYRDFCRTLAAGPTKEAPLAEIVESGRKSAQALRRYDAALDFSREYRAARTSQRQS